TNALTGQTQLRQRVAFALHQTLVVSNLTINRPSWMTPYLQALDRNAFGSYRTLLNEVTLTPAMGDYLDMNQSTAASPNENFAREINQLFSVGTNQLNLDGTPFLDSQGNPVPTYSQTTERTVRAERIERLARRAQQPPEHRPVHLEAT